MQCKNCYGTVAEFLAVKDAKIAELTATNAKLEAECARYKYALTQITYSHDGYAKDAAEKALGNVE
jgi:hypothetical protein